MKLLPTDLTYMNFCAVVGFSPFTASAFCSSQFSTNFPVLLYLQVISASLPGNSQALCQASGREHQEEAMYQPGPMRFGSKI